MEICNNIQDNKCSAHNTTESFTCILIGPSIPIDKVCDGKCDCVPLCDDESQCNGITYGLFCNFSSDYYPDYNPPIYIPAMWICDNYKDCTDERDEVDCDATPQCSSGPANRTLTPRTRCAPLGMLGDRPEPYCLDYSDQLNCTDPSLALLTCTRDGFPVTVANRMICHGIKHVKLCDDGFEDMCVRPGTGCKVHKHLLCDGNQDCVSGADENHVTCWSLSNTECERGFGGRGKLRIPLSWINDEFPDCKTGEDEGVVYPTCGKTSATLRLRQKQECEEVFLCGLPPSDHIEFHNLCNKQDKCGNEREVCIIATDSPTIQQNVPRNGQKRVISYCHKGLETLARASKNCTEKHFQYHDYDVLGRSEVAIQVPNREFDCNVVFGELYVYLSCLGQCPSSTCPLTTPPQHYSCSDQYPDKVYTLANNSFLSFLLPFHDHTGKDFYHNDIFQCGNGKCVSFEMVCNLADDCGDNSDEINCTNHFACETTGELVPLNSVCDGKKDCKDHSDECNERCNVLIIQNKFLEGLAWLLGILATLLNLIIVVRGVYSLRRADSVAQLLNRILILLIGLGDLLVGVYLIAITVYHTLYRHIYCINRYEWLTSSPCWFMGVLNAVGSQLSLFSMTILSLTRVFRMSTVSISDEKTFRSTAVLLLMGFVIFSASVLVAAVPLLHVFEDFFVNGLYYPKNPLFVGEVKKSRHMQIFVGYFGRMKVRELSWKNIGKLSAAMFSEEYGGIISKQVHFYGNDGVCLFKFFVTTDDPQKVYVWAILAINVVCFALITVAYVVIHSISITSSSQFADSETNQQLMRRNRRLQRKITLIILTDFCCWIPFITMCILHSVEVVDASPYYALFSIVVLPINSVINPLLYDDTIGSLVSKVCLLLKLCQTGKLDLLISKQRFQVLLLQLE